MIPCTTAQWTHFFPNFSFAAHIPLEALFVALHIPFQIQLWALAFLTPSLHPQTGAPFRVSGMQLLKLIYEA